MSIQDLVNTGTHDAHRRSQRRRRGKKRRGGLIALIGLLIMVVAVGGVYVGFKPVWDDLTAPKDFPGPGSGEATVKIPLGSTGNNIAQILFTAGVVKTTQSFSSAAADDPRSQQIQPGTYRLLKQMTAKAALALLLDPKARLTIKVTIAEGKRVDQIVDQLVKVTGRPKATFDAALQNPADLGLPASANGLVEGYLFPATYQIEPDDTAPDILRRMIERAGQALQELGVPAERQHDLVVEASLVQAEAGQAADMPKIARVLSNRVTKKWPLGLDTTIHYATGKFTVGTSIKETQIKSPYNTYTHTGLPPGAICSPGTAALAAVLNPEPGPWMYFVAVNPSTGETKFATTSAEFAKLKAESDAWSRAHPGQ